MSDYRRPGVYLTENLNTSPAQGGSTNAVAVFVGVASKGETGVATRIDSWSDFVQKFGGFAAVPVTDASVTTLIQSFLPYAVYCYYQNGGRAAYIIRAANTASGQTGSVASVTVNDVALSPPHASFVCKSNGAGTWGNDLTVTITNQATAPSGAKIFGLAVKQGVGTAAVVVESFNNLSMVGIDGTRSAVAALNDSISGSRYLDVTAAASVTIYDPKDGDWPLVGGTNPGTPIFTDLTTGAAAAPIPAAIHSIDGPLIVNFCPFRLPTGVVVMPTAATPAGLNDLNRSDIFCVWDSVLGSGAANTIATTAASLSGDAYSALYTPWINIPDPVRTGATILVPPGGSVIGMMTRIDSTIGVWRAPAGLPAVLNSAISCETKFTDTEQGTLNYQQVNVIRTVPGNGVCVMGARTRKLYGPDRYISARRTLIYIENSLRNSTQFAVFMNNDQRLWSLLRNTARGILLPIWEQGGLAGASPGEAFFIVCDQTINTQQVVQSGEVRLDVGVALQFPAEFVVIRVSQFDSGASLTAELLPA